MKLLFGYTLDYLKRNRRGSLAIMIAILMTATMMSALSGFLYNVYADSVSYILSQTGNWHGELFDNTPATALNTIESFDSVEAVLLKGQWKAASIEDPRRDYLIWRDANAEYWNSMPEGDSCILEGRAPDKVGEIALSKQYFEHHPELALGDSLTLPIGDRMDADGGVLAPQNTAKPGERFQASGTVTLTVVGKLDFTTSSNVPAYTALGFLSEADILPTDDLTVYLRFHNLRDTYKELPKIAAAIGYEPDEYGNYVLRYNADYLSRKNVLSPEQKELLPLLMASQGFLTYGFIGLLVVSLFVLVIHNAFALSFTARLSQLGIFASAGATPQQIKQSVVSEALLLTAIPLPIGLIVGQLCIAGFIQYSNQFGTPTGRELMQFAVSPISVLPAILLTLLTVYWSALIPARKIAKMCPIDAIRQGETQTFKKPGRFSLATLGHLFGLPGELAATALQARKKSYRTATISLTLSFLTLACFLCINSASEAGNAVYQTEQKKWAEQDVLVTLMNVTTPEDCRAVTQNIDGLPGVKSAVWYNQLNAALWLPETGFSQEFAEKGGFDEAGKDLPAAQLPLLRDGQRRVKTALLGLDDKTFAAYCATLGIDPAPFYDESTWRSILYHTVTDVTTSTKRNPVRIPFLSLSVGDTITMTEKASDSFEGDFTFSVEIAAVADTLPPIGDAYLGVRYSAVQVMPMSRVTSLGTNFARNASVKVEGVLQAESPALITPVRQTVETICESYFGSGDYELFDQDEYNVTKTAGNATTTALFGFISALLAIIGLSNAWATVRGTLHARRREFAMLRSVGLPPAELRRMLVLEGMMLGLTPVLLSLPVVIIVQCAFLSTNEITFFEWLPFAPLLPMLAYLAAVLAAMLGTYIAGCRKLLRENIIEAIKIDSI